MNHAHSYWIAVDFLQCIGCRHWMMIFKNGWVCANITCDNFGKEWCKCDN